MNILKRILSMVLVLATVLTVLVGFPPVEAGAATATCSSKKCNGCDLKCTFNPDDTLTWGDELSFSGQITSSSTIQKVTVRVYDVDDNGKTGFEIYTNQSVGSKTFYLSDISDLTAGENLSKDWNGVTIVIYVVLSNETNAHHEFVYNIKFKDLITPEISSPDNDDTFYAGDDITFKWRSVSDAEGFEWEFYETDHYYGKLLDSGTTGTTSSSRKAVIDGDSIKVGKTYSFYVRAVNDYSNSDWACFNFYAYAKPSELYADAEKLSFTKDGGKNYIELTSSHAWTATVTDSWIKLSAYSGTGDEEITVTVSSNTGEYRAGSIIFQSNVGSITVYVDQKSGETPRLDVNTTQIQISYEEGYASFYVTSNLYDWTVSCNVDWLNEMDSELDLNDRVKFSIDENNSTEPRTGTITVSGGGITKTVTVTQAGRPAIVGDINNDGEITNKDRFILNRYLAGMAGYTNIDKSVADINGDGSVNAADVEYLTRYLAGWAGYEKLPEINTGSNVCAHTQYTDTYAHTVYVSNTIKTDTTHVYYHVYNRTCSCGVDIGEVQDKLLTEAHEYVNNLCACGAYKNASYTSWTGINASGTQANVYSTPSATLRYGYINKDEVVMVIGEYGDKYLIEYTLDSGNGIKQGYVNKSCIEKIQPYNIYIDHDYFIENVNYYGSEKLFVAEYGTVCPVKIYNSLSNTYEEYGASGLVIESSNTDAVDINYKGQLMIKGTGPAQLFLKYNGELQDTVDVFGCDYWTLVNTDDILDKQYSPAKGDGISYIAGKVNMFDYNSVYVSDASWDGGGYHKVTFNLYNSSLSAFSVVVYNKDRTIIKEEKVAAHIEGGMFDQMWVHLSNMNDIWNGDLIGGRSEMMYTKTPIEIKVPLGGAVLITSGSEYVLKENIINLIMLAIDTFSGVNGLLKDAGKSYIDVDAFIKKLSEKLRIPEAALTAKVLEIVSDKGDVGDAITALLGTLFDEGITSEDVMEIYLDAMISVPDKTLEHAVNELLDKGLAKVPWAKIIVDATDTLLAGGNALVLLKTMKQYSDYKAHLIIHYSATP